MIDLEAIAAQIREDVLKMDKQQTNADMIRAMNDEELAIFLKNFDLCNCCNRSEYRCEKTSDCEIHSVEVALDWLQQEVK